MEIPPRFPNLTAEFPIQMAGGVLDEIRSVEYPDRIEQRTKVIGRLARVLDPLSGWAERSAAAKGKAFFARVFSKVDLILMPTTATAAEEAGQIQGLGAVATALKALPIASYTSIWNTLGNPAAAIPTGVNSQGLPLSAQIVGPPQSEQAIVALAAQIEREQPWADRYPTSW